MQTCNCGKHAVPAAQIVPVNCEFVIPASYPYVRPAVDSYECCCPTSQPSMKDYPTSGPYKGNAFVLDNANPYLIDTTFYAYGQALAFDENIYPPYLSEIRIFLSSVICQNNISAYYMQLYLTLL